MGVMNEILRAAWCRGGVHSIINASVFIADLIHEATKTSVSISCHCLCGADPCLCSPYIKGYNIHLLVHAASVRMAEWGACGFPHLSLGLAMCIISATLNVPLELTEKVTLQWDRPLHFKFKHIYLKVFSRTHPLIWSSGKREEQSPSRLKPEHAVAHCLDSSLMQISKE